jgi:hypothetical protein
MATEAGGNATSDAVVGDAVAVSPDAETQNQASEVVETVESETIKEEVVDAEPETEPQGDDVDKALKRMQRRIDKRTADLYRERARSEELARRVEQLEAKTRTEEAVQIEDPVKLARHISSVDRFTEKSNQLVDQGTKAHADYMLTMKELALEVGPLVNRDETPSQFMAVVLEVAEKPSELLYYLGKNPDIAGELSGLNQIQLTKKLDRIEREMVEASKPKISNAPKPLEPVKGKPSDSELGPGLSDAEWMKRREAQVREARGR